MAANQVAPVSIERVKICLSSAGFWVNELPRYADRRQRSADRWAIASGVFAATTGLAIFPVLTSQSTVWEKAVVSAVAFLAAICALIPRVKNYGELAGQARELTSQYGAVDGKLLDVSNANPLPAEAASAAVAEFQSIKAKKDALRGLPDRAAVEISLAKKAAKLADAKTKELEAQKRTRDARRNLDPQTDQTATIDSQLVYEDEWGEIIDRGSRDLIELRWFDATADMPKEQFEEWLQLFAGHVGRLRRSRVLIEGTNFKMNPAFMDGDWRDANIIPRYNAAGVKSFAFHMPAAMPMVGQPPAREGPGEFPTGYFGRRAEALGWLTSR